MTNPATDTPAAHLSQVILHDGLPGDLPPMIEADRAQAVLDLEGAQLLRAARGRARPLRAHAGRAGRAAAVRHPRRGHAPNHP